MNNRLELVEGYTDEIVIVLRQVLDHTQVKDIVIRGDIPYDEKRRLLDDMSQLEQNLFEQGTMDILVEGYGLKEKEDDCGVDKTKPILFYICDFKETDPWTETRDDCDEEICEHMMEATLEIYECPDGILYHMYGVPGDNEDGIGYVCLASHPNKIVRVFTNCDGDFQGTKPEFDKLVDEIAGLRVEHIRSTQ